MSEPLSPRLQPRPLESGPPPLSSAPIWSTLIWSWVGRILEIGMKRPLRTEHLDHLCQEDSAEVLRANLRRTWQDEVDRAQKSQAHSHSQPLDQTIPVFRDKHLRPLFSGNLDAVMSRPSISLSKPPLVSLGISQDTESKHDTPSSIPRPSASFLEVPSVPRTTNIQGDQDLRALPSPGPQYRPSLFRALVRSFGARYALVGILQLVYSFSKIMQAVFLRFIIQFVSDSQSSNPPPAYEGYLFAAGMGLSSLTQAVVHHQYFMRAMRVGTQARIALFGLVYDKSLALGTASFLSTTTGQVVNLISNDAYKAEELSPFAHYLWAAPMETIIVLVLLLLQIGPAALAGLGCMFLLIPVQSFFANRFGIIRKNTLKYTDQRVKTINEILVGCEVMKLYNWEEPLQQVVTRAREKEFTSIRLAATFKAINQAIFFFSSSLVCYVTFSVYMSISSTNSLDPADLFATVALFNVIRLPMTNFMPFAIEKASEFAVSLRRLGRFLDLTEIEHLSDTKLSRLSIGSPPVPQGCVEVADASFSWETVSRVDLQTGLKEPTRTITSVTAAIEDPSRVTKQLHRVKDVGAPVVRADPVALSSQDGRLVDDAEQVEQKSESDSDDEDGQPYRYYYEADDSDRVDTVDASTHVNKGDQKPNRAVSVFQEQLQQFQQKREARKHQAAQPSPSLQELQPHSTVFGAQTEIKRADVEFLHPMDTGPALTLKHINFRLSPGELLGVVGPIGSCKSSLLAALLGEMENVSGTARIEGSIALAPQKPCIFATTLRENIVFGRPFEVERYLQVLEACQLVDDIETLHSGEQTIIGERGVNLSGGQKARVSLARAVYSHADVYLFDDVLSAVDVLVARRIFDQVLGPRGLLRDKTRLFVTHQTYLLPFCDRVLVLDRGTVRYFGTHSEILRAGFDFDLQLAESSPNREGSAVTSAQGSLAPGTEDFSSSNLVLSSPPSAADPSSSTRSADRTPQVTDTTVKKSAQVTDNADVQHGKNIIQDEERGVGSIGWPVYREFILGAGGYLVVFACFLLMLMMQSSGILCSFWLAYWSRQSPVEQQSSLYIDVYSALVFSTIGFALLCCLITFRVILRGAYSLHSRMFQGVLFSSLRFFEAHPVGRILNRFSKDQAVVDESLPLTSYDFFQCSFAVVGSICVIAAINPYTLAIVVLIVPLFIYVYRRYTVCSREIKRLESTSRSPIFAHFSATLAGLMVIRAFRVQNRFSLDFSSKIDDNSRNFFAFLTTSRWLGFRLDFFSALMVLGTAMLSIAERNSISPSNLGFALLYSLTLTSLFQWVIRQSTELENQMTSVERVVEYSKLPPEGQRVVMNNRPPPGWPSQGRVIIQNLRLKYKENLDWVLRGVNAEISPQEKVGIVGRTGAGKSSLFGAFFRLVEPTEGQIIIDDVDICKIGLSDLRSQLSIIPQNPVIFSGSLRYNLDPFRRCSTEEIWNALEAVQLKQMIVNLPEQLDTRMAEFGANFSIGEAQLVCVARALLKPSKILLVDEATASVDPETDQLIQAVIRQRFRNRTVITIAHRLHTIIDSDRVIVMSAGEVAEFDTPQNLIAVGGVFASMAQNVNLR